MVRKGVNDMTTSTFVVPADTGRDLDAAELVRQIGANIWAISGGRASRVGSSSLVLPAGAGFEVLVTLEADDTYTVRRLFKRSGQWFLHGEREQVYADEVGEVAYYASCFRSYDDDEWPQQV
jgi:hypothetical protein